MMGIRGKILRTVLTLQPKSTKQWLVDSFITPSLYTTSLKPDLKTEIFPALRDIKPSVLEMNLRFRAFVRNYYLSETFGKDPIFHGTKAAEVRNILLSYSELPSKNQVKEIFPEIIEKWNKSFHADEEVIRKELIKKAQDEMFLQKGSFREENGWNLENSLEAIGCCILGAGRWNLFCERNKVYDLITSEYVTSLANSIRSISNKIDHTSSLTTTMKKKKISILEVGAGTGRLSHFLRRELDPLEYSVTATDNGAWNIPVGYEVKKMDYFRAVDEIRPDIVLTSWMPMGEDWTWYFRSQSNLKAYILIGEVDWGCCGDPIKTWGMNPENRRSAVPSFVHHYEPPTSLDIFDLLSKSAMRKNTPREAKQRHQLRSVDIPAYRADGFERQQLDEASKLQYSRYDRENCASCSRTVVFTRYS